MLAVRRPCCNLVVTTGSSNTKNQIAFNMHTTPKHGAGQDRETDCGANFRLCICVLREKVSLLPRADRRLGRDLACTLPCCSALS